MHFFVLKENLNKILSILSRNISSRPQIPILSNVLIKTDKGQIKFAVTNLEIGLIFSIPAKIEKEGEVTVPGKLLTEFVSNLIADKVEFNLEGNNLHVKTDKTKAVFSTMPTGDFPPFLEPPQIREKFRFEKIKDAIIRTVFAASTDEGRPVLTGIRTILSDGKMSFAATDGYRLSVESVNIPDKRQNFNIILPAQPLSEVIRIAQEVKAEELEFALIENKNQAVFVFPNGIVFTRLIEGEFPNIEKIIPQGGKTRVVIDKDDFFQSVKTTSLFARGAANIIKIKISKDGLHLSANTPQVGEDEDYVEARVEGEETEIAFNFRFLLDLLANYPEESIVFETNGSLNPGVFKPISSSLSFLHIIMPVRVQG
ncbi:DNA polymerase III subunit beta [Patescibacteria group bacterium]|nr:DNA polymerase III subunit beta [Patescibacteria group bacterium]MCL5797187.1 DNA polymerase III subunit beta [Patescibacteria group bacterium]